jgi:hypothetical protein
MTRLVPCLLVLALLLDPSAAAGAAKEAVPNKNVAVVSVTGAAVPFATSTAVAKASLAKGRKHRILIISGSATTMNPCMFIVVPQVNGIPPGTLGLSPAYGDLKSSGAFALTASAEWGLDLDTLEAANPGVFLNKPLVVELMVTNLTLEVETATFTAGLVVRLEKR